MKPTKQYSNFVNRKSSDDDDFEEIQMKGNLPFAVDTSVVNTFTVPIDENIEAPSYYRGVLKMMQDASAYDVVKFPINSNGGRLDGLASLLHGINTTEATTLAEIVGECNSAASILALACDQVIVGENASMLCHSARWGYAGKGSDVIAHANHCKKISDRLMKEVYADFLSDSEIESVLAGQELYLDADEIAERLSQREEIRSQYVVDEEVVED